MKTHVVLLTLLLFVVSPSFAAVKAHRVSLLELSSSPKDYEGQFIETSGTLLQTAPSYFPKPVFMLSNGVEKVRVSSWLPLEVAPAPRGMSRQRKKVMSDLIGKKVTVTGKVVLENGKPFIEVKDAKSVESQDGHK